MFDKRNMATLREMVRTDFKLRYQDSVLGYLWSLMRPLLLFGVLYVLFGIILDTGDDVEHFATYLLLGVVLWTYFTEITQRSITVIVDRGDLLRKISIPRHLLVFAVGIGATINVMISFLVVIFFALFDGATVSGLFFLMIPLMIELFALGLGVGLLLSALFVKIRDISYLWEVILQAGFYATPILYGLQQVPEQHHWLFFLNPVAQIIQDMRALLVSKDAITVWSLGHWWLPIIPLAIVLILLCVGIAYFRKEQKFFAENL